MVKTKEILQAIKANLEVAFPGEDVHLNRVRENFKRPANMVEGGKFIIHKENKYFQERRMDVLITTFVDVDARYDSQYDALLDRAETIAELFGGSVLPVGERKLTIGDVSFEYGRDYAEVRVFLSWGETVEYIETAAVAQQIQTNQEIKEGGA